MTIIACSARERAMISDTLITTDEGRFRNAYGTKIVECKDGSLAGAAGDIGATWAFLKWAQEGRHGLLPAELWGKESSLEGIVLTKDAEIFWYSSPYPDFPYGDTFAIGMGNQVCMAALMAGASLQRAVEIACELCTQCGGPLTTLALKSQAKTRKRYESRSAERATSMR